MGPTLMLMCGLPGSGKTTLAKHLAATRNALRLTQDDWLFALDTTPWDDAARSRVDAQLWNLALEVLRLGTNVVVDFGVWSREERDDMRTTARAIGVGVELHFLHAPVDELWARVDARNAVPPWNAHPIERSHLDEWCTRFEAPDADEFALFDAPFPA